MSKEHAGYPTIWIKQSRRIPLVQCFFHDDTCYLINEDIQNGHVLCIVQVCTEAEFLDEIHKKVLRLLAFHSHLYRFDLRFPFLHIHETPYSFYSFLLYTTKEKIGKPDRKPYLLP
jgi:hypothetical protein